MSERSASARFTIGEWLVDPAVHQLARNGETIVVEPQVMEVLVYLAHHAGEVISHNELIDNIWRGSIVTENAVYQKIAKLRHALHDDPHDPCYVETIPRGGYRLIVPVVPVESDASRPIQTRHGRREVRAQSRHFLSTISLLLVTGFLFLSHSDVSIPSVQNTFLASQVGSIAVLPFIDMSGNGDQAYLGDGIADEVLHTLSSIPDIRVVARTSSFAVRDRALDIRDIGQKLNVDVILEGSVRRFGDRIRITAQMIHAETGYHIWSQSYDQTFADVLAIQQEIAVNVARTLRTDFRRNGQVLTTNPEAYDHYLLGKHQLTTRRPENLRLALAHLQQAIEIDSEFGLAHANLSWAYMLASQYGPLIDSRENALKSAESAARKAVQLDDSQAEAWASLFYVHGWNVLELDELIRNSNGTDSLVSDARDKELAIAKRAIFRAMELNPNSAFVNRGYTYYLGLADRPDDLFRQQMRLVELDPLSAIARTNLAFGYGVRGQFEKAENEIRIAAELEPSLSIPWYTGARIFFQTDRLDEAIKWTKTAIDIEGPAAAPVWAWEITDAYLTLGDYASAETWMSRALELNKPQWWIDLQKIQMYLAQENDHEAHVLLKDWLARIPEDYLCCHRTLMLLTVADAVSFGALAEMIVGHDEHAADLYGQALSLPRERQHYDGDSNNLFGHDVLVGWGYLPAVNRAHLYQRAGQLDKVDQLYDQSIEYLDTFETATRNGVPLRDHLPGNHYVRASIYNLRGDKKKALAEFRMAVSKGWNRAWYARRDPNMAGLQDDPEFQSILQDIDDRLAAMRERVQLINVAGTQ